MWDGSKLSENDYSLLCGLHRAGYRKQFYSVVVSDISADLRDTACPDYDADNP